MKESTPIFVATLLMVLGISCQAQLISLGNCPVLTPLTPIRPALITRLWFEHSRTPSINEHGLRCVSGSVTFNNAFAIRYSARSKLGSARINLNGNAVFIAGDNVGAFSLSFRNNRFPFARAKPLTLTIIAMDGLVNIFNPNAVIIPPTFMTLYSCKDMGLFKMETSYILTTLRVPAPATVAAALATLTARNLPTDNLKEIDQSNC